jgi:hypothetical protein
VTVVPAAEVRRRRLATQRLGPERLADPAAVVGLLTAVQSQEFGHALWSLGMRSAGTYADAQAAFDRGELVRTHVLRPTWHLIRPEDVGWLLALTAPRVHQLNGTMYRKLGLDRAALDRAAGVIVDALGEGTPLTRNELGRRLGSEGLTLVYQVMNAELEGLIVSGPLRGAQQTYAPMADRVPVAARRTGDLGELAYRFFAGHGPASVRDLARWASLTSTAAAAATEAAAPRAGLGHRDRWVALVRPGRPGPGGGDGVRGPAAAALRRADAELPRPGLPAGGRAPPPAG